MQISQTQVQLKALSDLQRRCDIEAITLQCCNAVRAKAGTQFREPFTVKPSLCNTSWLVQDQRLIVEVSFEYTAWDSSEPQERLFLATCTFEVSYTIRDGYSPTEQEKSSFSRGTGVFNCWPYAREFLRDITARMGHLAPTLPLLRMIPKRPPEASPAVAQMPVES